jgi:hypothetical protein
MSRRLFFVFRRLPARLERITIILIMEPTITRTAGGLDFTAIGGKRQGR